MKMPKKSLATLKTIENPKEIPETEPDTEPETSTPQYTIPKYKTVTILSINPVDPSMWKYAEQETAKFYEILQKSPEAAFTHIFTNLKVEIKTIQIEV